MISTFIDTFIVKLKKLSLYRPGQALGVLKSSGRL
jgi:hypothetical protein